MALTPFAGFIGGSYTSWTPYADAQQSMNLFVEQVESQPAAIAGGSSVPAKLVLLGTPGLTLFETMATTGCRGIWIGEGRCFVVFGSKLYEVFASGTGPTLRGDVGTDGLPVQIFPNGTQIMIISAGVAYIDSGAGPVAATFSPALAGVVNTAAAIFPFGSVVTWVSGDDFTGFLPLQPIIIAGVAYSVSTVADSTHLRLTADAGTHSGSAYSAPTAVTAVSGAFLDGYFIIAVPSSKRLYISGINDGLSWNSLDFALKEGYPDILVALLADHLELWLFGSQTTEIWRNTGAANFPLERDPGAFMNHGCIAPATPCRLGEGVAWLSGDPRGGPVAMVAVGFMPQRVSTHAIEAIWRGYSTVNDATSYVYIDQGHEFWVLQFPTANATWVYDRTSGFWAPRGWWNGATIDRQRGAFHGYVFGKHLVGDWSNGKIYEMNMAFYDDAGTQINRIRAARVPSNNGADWTYLTKFRLIAENSGALNPSMDYSIDGGKNFIGGRTTAAPFVSGAYGYYDWRRFARARDRVMRVTITAAVKVALIAGEVDQEA